jgi:hypothetical protein
MVMLPADSGADSDSPFLTPRRFPKTVNLRALRRSPLKKPFIQKGDHYDLLGMDRFIPWGLVLGLFLMRITSFAQAPDNIAGRTLFMTISSGTPPFAGSGSYRILPSATDNWYAVVPVTANIAASAGFYSYTRLNSTTASVSVTDSLSGTSIATLTFTSSASGTFTVSNAFVPTAHQNGTFTVFSGRSPDRIAGDEFAATVTSGASPLASSGSYRLSISPTGSAYTVHGIVGVADSAGTCSYTKNSATTGLLAFTDSGVGQGSSVQMSFDSPTSGTIVILLSSGTGYQTAIFTITASVLPPAVTLQPQSQTLSVGGTAVFTTSASGTLPLAYQWRKDNVDIPGATGATDTLNNVQAGDAGNYSVRISNAAGSTTSAPAALVILQAPKILVQPIGATIGASSNIVLSVTASGSGPLFYQWRFNDSDIIGATGSSYSLNNAESAQSGAYTVRVTNAAGSINSDPTTILIWRGANVKPSFAPLSLSGTNPVVKINGLEDHARYRLQVTPNLFRWTEVTNLIATQTTFEIVDSIGLSWEKRFYRLVSP